MGLPAIDPLPTAPSRSDEPALFITRADAFLASMAILATQINAFGEAVEAAAQATNYNATSASSVAIGTGSKSFVASTGTLLKAGQFVSIASASGPGNAMLGTVTSYNATTGALVVNVTAVTGSGTKNDWIIALSVNPALLGAINTSISTLQGDLTALSAFKGVPQNPQNGTYTLAIGDQGRQIYSANTGAQAITLPANASVAFPVGATISIINDGTSNITLSPAGGVTLRLAGTSTTGARTIAPGSVATLIKVGTDRWFISGVGVA